MLDSSFGFYPSIKTIYENKVCPLCNMDLNTYIRTGILGCGKCYEVFKDNLESKIEKIHGKTQHIGKVPSKANSTAKILKALNEELSLAVQREDYVEAARIRDVIREHKSIGK